MVTRAGKVAVSIDAEVLREVERLRESTGEARSTVVTRALRMLLAKESRRSAVSAYVDGYRRLPESDGDVARARREARNSLRGVAWDGP